jgi:hypothetical protein
VLVHFFPKGRKRVSRVHSSTPEKGNERYYYIKEDFFQSVSECTDTGGFQHGFRKKNHRTPFAWNF